jgi:hypothetical protein
MPTSISNATFALISMFDLCIKMKIEKLKQSMTVLKMRLSRCHLHQSVRTMLKKVSR